MTAKGKLKVFAPQLAEVGASTLLWTGVAASHSVPVIVLLCILGGVTGLVAAVTAMNKACDINDHGWDKWLHGGCDACRRHAHQVEELRQTILLLNPRED